MDAIGNHIVAWAGGGLAALILPFVLKWAGSKGLNILKAWELRKIQELLKAQTGDAALDQFNRDIVLAVAKLMQAKMPKDGLGPERKKAAIDFLISKFPWFAGKESALSALIDQIVESQAAVLDAISSQG